MAQSDLSGGSAIRTESVEVFQCHAIVVLQVCLPIAGAASRDIA
jgi:hypothetical protein